MRIDVELAAKGTVVVCDRAAIEPRPKHGDDVLDRSGYEEHARRGQLFFFEPRDAIAGPVAIFVEEGLPSALAERVYGSVRGRLLRVPSGEVLVGRAQLIAEDAAAEELAGATRLKLAPGDYRVDAHVIAPSDDEMAGPPLEGNVAWASNLQTVVVLASVWFAFCTLCYVVLVFQGLARDALRIYGLVGVGPLALSVLVFYVSGARRRLADAAKAFAALPSTPSLVVVLTPKGDAADVTEGGGLAEEAFAGDE